MPKLLKGAIILRGIKAMKAKSPLKAENSFATGRRLEALFQLPGLLTALLPDLSTTSSRLGKQCGAVIYKSPRLGCPGHCLCSFFEFSTAHALCEPTKQPRLQENVSRQQQSLSGRYHCSLIDFDVSNEPSKVGLEWTQVLVWAVLTELLSAGFTIPPSPSPPPPSPTPVVQTTAGPVQQPGSASNGLNNPNTPGVAASPPPSAPSFGGEHFLHTFADRKTAEPSKEKQIDISTTVRGQGISYLQGQQHAN